MVQTKIREIPECMINRRTSNAVFHKLFILCYDEMNMILLTNLIFQRKTNDFGISVQ